MSTSIPGRGKQRKHGQDLNTNAMSMGGGQMAMPPNGAAAPFATPIVNQQPHVPEYAARAYEVQHQHQPLVSGTMHPTMLVPTGTQVQQEQPSQYANMQGLPQNMQNMRGNAPVNQNMQWQGQQNTGMHTGMAQPHMNRGGQQQGRYNGQQPQQAQMGYAYPTAVPPTAYYMAPNMYPQQYTQQEAYAAACAQQQQQQHQFYQQQLAASQMMPQHIMQQQQAGVPMPMYAAPPSLQQGGAAGGAAAGAPMGGVPPAQQQQQPNHGGVPSSVAQPMHNVPVTAPAAIPQSVFNPTTMQPPQQPRPAAPIAPKKKNILLIVDPTTNKAINDKDVEESKREEEDAPKAEKEEAKGTDETDSSAPEVKKQFATQILEQTTKSEQPAPAPPPVAPVKERKSLFSAEQIKQLGLEDKRVHVPAPPARAPAPAPVAAAPAAEQTGSEYLPAPLDAPAYPNNYKEKQAKEASPDVTLSEMPAVNNEEHPEDSHLAEVTPPIEEPASSSSDKNTSNDSAICVQTPVTPPPPTESIPTVVDADEATPPAAAADEVVVEDEEEKEEAEVEEPVTEADPLSKKLEQLVIAESASQEEAESEPSTPAPVTPSVSETAATLAEEEEDAEKAAAAAEEERQRKRAELEDAIAKNEEDIEQVNEEIGWYNREYLYNVRDLEKLFAVTPCPLTPHELKDFGICRSLVSNEPKRKQDGQGGFMPGWARSQGGGGGQRGGHDRKQAYQGRQSEQHHRGGGRGPGSNKKLPPSIRPSIERRVETNVQLHKAEKAWKPEKVTETDESDETKKKLLLKTIRSLFNKITPTTKDALINEFLDHKVYESPSLPEVISIIFDKAVEEPKFCPLYASMCQIQVKDELTMNSNVSNFRNAILVRAQETFTKKDMEDLIKEKEAEIEAETDEKKKKEKKIELLEHKSKFRRRKFGNITFIGQLYLQNLISVRIILFCVVDLLKSVTEKPENLEGYEADEESVDCAVRLLETIGKRLQEEANAAARAAAENKAAASKPAPKIIQRGGNPAPPPPQAQPQPPKQTFPLDMTFQTLEGAIPIVSSRIKFMIMNLSELRKNGWVPRKTADAGPKKLDEIKKDIQKEQLENQHAAQQYERKQSRQEPMGGRGGPMGGGHGGGNPKRQIIQRNSTDRGTAEDRRSQAFKAANLARTAPQKKNVSLSSVTNDGKSSLGGKKESKWSGGASGGSENSRKEERSAAIQSTSRFMAGNRSSSAASMKGAEEEGTSASGTATQANSEDEREQNEQREKQEAELTKRCMCDVGDYGTAEISLDEVREEIFKSVDNEKFSKPSLQTVFKCFMAAAVKKASSAGGSELVPKFGHVLAYCLLKKAEEKDTKGREEILKGVAECFRDIVEQEKWDDVPKIWDFTAEVLIHAHMPEDGLFEGAHPTLTDFKDSFLNAAKDETKPYALFVLVLKRLAEMHYKRDKNAYMEIASWVLDECTSIIKHMDEVKLDNALKATKMEFADNLHVIMRQNH